MAVKKIIRKRDLMYKYQGQVYSRTKRPDKKDFRDDNSGEKLVETAGYVRPKDRIEGMLAMGQHLMASRKDQYDFLCGEKDIDFDYVDPTRRRNIDPAEIQELTEGIMKPSEKLLESPDSDQDKKEGQDTLDDKKVNTEPENGSESNPE